MKYKAVVLLSGGVDSALCLQQAIKDHGGPSTVAVISYNYGQKHIKELDAARKIVSDFKINLHKIVDLTFLHQISTNALMSSDIGVNDLKENGDVATLVVGRNGLFLRVASIWANSIGASKVYIGINELDAINYRDCSREYMDKIESILKMDLKDVNFKIVTPISGMTKENTMKLADDFQILDYVMKETVTCYNGVPADGCGECLACKLRKEGFDMYQSKKTFSK